VVSWFGARRWLRLCSGVRRLDATFLARRYAPRHPHFSSHRGIIPRKALAGKDQQGLRIVDAMRFDSVDEVSHSGFQGFVPISALQASNCRELPDVPGVYLVLRPIKTRPVFLRQSTGGHFKSKNPTVAINELKNSWAEESVVVYIGKAGGTGMKASLRSRLIQYMRFGQGKAVGHWGGRYIWQLCHSGSLVVCWKSTPSADPRVVEKGLLQEFKATYGRRPFANRRG